MDKSVRTMERRALTGDVSPVGLLRVRERADGFDPRSVTVLGETREDVEVTQNIADDVKEIVAGGMFLIVAVDSDAAGRVARQRWADMAEHDPTEFRHIVGDESLVAWALGQPGGPGTTKVSSLTEWLDLFLDTPAEELASWDHQERDVSRVGSEVAEQLGFIPTVAYRVG